MADVALWSGATGAGNGTSWADAYTTLAAVITAQGLAPTRIFVASEHSELVTAALTFPPNVQNHQYQIISADRTSGFPPTVEQAGASIRSTDSVDLTLNNSVYSKGVFWAAGNGGATTRNITLSHATGGLPHVYRIVGGGLELKNSAAASRIIIGGAGLAARNSEAFIEGAELRFGNVSQGVQSRNCAIFVRDGNTAGSAITEFIKSFSDVGASLDVFGLDMSSCATGVNLLAANIIGAGRAMFNCIKMPTGWTGDLIGTLPVNSALTAIASNVDAGDTNYRMSMTGGAYQVRSETAIYRSGGAGDGTTPISWKYETSDKPIYPVHVTESLPIIRWNETTGSAITATIHILTDGVTLKDDEAWLEIMYLDDAGFPIAVLVSDERPSQLAAAADQDASTATWTTTGITTPVKQKLSVTFTPQEKGFIKAKVRVAKPSTTIYVCPQLEVA